MTNLVYITIFLIFFFGAVTYGFSLLPNASDYPLPEGVTDAINTIFGYMYAFDFILPVTEAIHILTLALYFHVAVFLYHRVVWVIKLIRGGNL